MLDLEVTRERFQLAAQRGYTPTGFLRHLAAILTSGDRRHLLEQLDLPCLVLHGRDDPLIPVAGGQALPGRSQTLGISRLQAWDMTCPITVRADQSGGGPTAGIAGRT